RLAYPVDDPINEVAQLAVAVLDHQRWLTLEMNHDPAEFVDAAFGPIEITEEGVYFLDSATQTTQRLFQTKLH
ncbi:MAG: hypothetical protein ACK52Y_06350, partial [Planctomycetota bacterium]